MTKIINFNEKHKERILSEEKIFNSVKNNSHKELYSNDEIFKVLNSKTDEGVKLRNLILDKFNKASIKENIIDKIAEEQILQLSIFSAKTEKDSIVALNNLRVFQENNIESKK